MLIIIPIFNQKINTIVIIVSIEKWILTESSINRTYSYINKYQTKSI